MAMNPLVGTGPVAIFIKYRGVETPAFWAGKERRSLPFWYNLIWRQLLIKALHRVR